MRGILILALVSLSFALPVQDDKAAYPEIIKSEYKNNGDKGYNFAVETSDGSKHEETGDFRYVGGLAVRGSYEFVDDAGKTHKVTYVADEKGFQPKIID